jgi:hypothetical protein
MAQAVHRGISVSRVNGAGTGTFFDCGGNVLARQDFVNVYFPGWLWQDVGIRTFVSRKRYVLAFLLLADALEQGFDWP